MTDQEGIITSSLGTRRCSLADVISSPEPTRRPSTTTRPHKTKNEGDEKKKKIIRSRSKSHRIKYENFQKSAPPLLSPTRQLQCEEEEENEDVDSTPTLIKEKNYIPPTSSERTMTDNSSISERDSLLERLREKEKQFDEKISTIDETLFCAERGRVHRDNIIDNLRAEVERLRAQLELTSEAKTQTEVLRDRILRERTAALEEARAKVDELNDRLLEKDRRVKQLENELKIRNSTVRAHLSERGITPTPAVEDKSLLPPSRRRQEQQQQQQQQQQSKIRNISNNNDIVAEKERERKSRERYADTLRAMQDEVNTLEQSHQVTRREKEALTEENNALRSKLEAIQESMESRVTRTIKAIQSNTDHKRELETELMTTRLSIARLLRLLSEVPEMRRYLRVSNQDGELLFVGYTTTSSSSTALGNQNLVNDNLLLRRRNISSLAVGPSSTGVDDGIYGGNTILQSYNVYLNGQWCKQLQEIIDDENYFLRRSKIHLGELEELAQSGKGEGLLRVPSPCDVLQGRQHDKDFWIPYAVFVEAQKFKNRYFPSLNHECFYPFLITINKVWNERMKQRIIAETRRRLREQQKQQQKHDKFADNNQLNGFPAYYYSSSSFNDSSRLKSSSASALWQQLQTLRREVRRRVTGKNSLELFHLYDQLTRCTLQQLRDVQAEHAELLEQNTYRHRIERARAEIDLVDDSGRIGIINEEEGNCDFDDVNGNEVNNNNDDKQVVILIQRALSDLMNEIQEVNERTTSRVVASCRDLQQFLGALRDQQLRIDSSEQKQKYEESSEKNQSLLHTTPAEYVPTSTLLRIIEGVLDFVEEVQREVFAARNAISRSIIKADERKELIFSPCGDKENNHDDVDFDNQENGEVEVEEKDNGRHSRRYHVNY